MGPNEPLDAGFVHPRLTWGFIVRSKSKISRGHWFKNSYQMELRNFTEDAPVQQRDSEKRITVKPSWDKGKTIWHVNGHLNKPLEILIPALKGQSRLLDLGASRRFEVRDRDKKKTVRFVIRTKRRWCRAFGRNFCPIVWQILSVWRPNGVGESLKRLRYYAVKDPAT